MLETKIEATHRLQREGRWVEATAFRDRVRRELRQAGKTKAEANDAAWSRMSAEFSPVNAQAVAQARQGQQAGDPVADEGHAFPINLAVGDGDFDAAITWAWNNLGDTVRPEDAPNGPAWCLRMFGVEEFDKFLPLVAKTIGLRNGNQRALKMREDRDRMFALLNDLSAVFEREAASVPQGSVGVATADLPLGS